MTAECVAAVGGAVELADAEVGVGAEVGAVAAAAVAAVEVASLISGEEPSLGGQWT